MSASLKGLAVSPRKTAVTSPPTKSGERSSTPLRRCSGEGATALSESDPVQTAIASPLVCSVSPLTPALLKAPLDLSPNEVGGEVA